jgi:copper(I)-binding protein
MFALANFIPGVKMLDRTPLFALAMAVLACAPGFAPAAYAAGRGSLAIEAPWCLTARPGTNAAGYLVIDNKSDAPDRLTSVTSPVAQHVSIHESRVTGGVATMALRNYVEIPGRSVISFASPGLHLMFEVLRRPLSVGERIPVTLWFRSGGPVHVDMVVTLRPLRSLPPAPMRM